ncbi:MAG: transcriptional regulator swi6 [Piccolia ochrophora]|nr:MAG: transcriptional regulator swi6 [Piccolia ochrophora]
MAYFPRPSQAHSDVGLQPPSSQGYGGEMNGVMHHGEPHRPQIYTAIYSGVPVYEMEVNQVAVMRRRADSWLNATQILKVAGVDKGKRTKVLEKEILVGEHEKVQGGYGKYQGTWINYQRGVEFCRQYGVEQLLKPLLEYDMGQDGANAGQGGIDTPTKEQAMAAQRKRLYNAGIENRSNGQSANGTFFKNISSTASNAVAAINKARFDSPGPRSSSANRRPQSARRPSFQQGSQESGYPGSSLQSMPSFASESSFGGNGSQNGPFGPDSQDPSRTADMQEPPRKRPRQSTSVDVSMQAPETSFDVSMRDGTPTEPNESFLYQQDYFPNEDDGVVPLEPLPRPTGKSAEEKIRLLTSLFLDPLQTDFTQHPAFTRLSRPDLDLPLDPTAHTALHWAATLARLPLLKALISRGASIFRVNGGGETALIRACVVTNNLDHGSFPELLELLGPTIEMRDGRGRTVLHHIAVSSAVKGRSAASRYYLESLLEFVVRQGSAPSSQQNSFHASATPVAMKAIGLGRFMSEIVNAQDKSGDTALNIAARIGNKSIIHQLIEVGADAGIPNRAGLKPSDFGIGDEADAKDPTLKETVDGVDGTVSKVVSETSQDIITSMTSHLVDTEREVAHELRSKQDQIDSAHAQLRECTALLTDERRKFTELQSQATARAERKHKIANLQRATLELRQKVAAIPSSSSPTRSPSTPLVNGQAPSGKTLPPLIALGDADANFTVPTPPTTPPSSSSSSPTNHTTHAYATSLPPVPTLRARLAAYTSNNTALRAQATQLRGRSAELETTYRRVVSLCTGVREDKVEELLTGLVAAVESERGGGVDMRRVREFMRRVEGVEG